MRVDDVVFRSGGAVPESEARSLAINAAVNDSVTDYLAEQRRLLRYSLGAGGAGVLIGLLLFASTEMTGAALGLLVLSGMIGGGGAYYARSREPDVTVEGLEKGYWTGHLIPSDDGVVVYDATASLTTTDFDLERLADRTQIATAHDTLKDIQEFPVVMPDTGNVEERFTTQLETVREEIESAEQRTVSAPIVHRGDPMAEGLSRLADHADLPSIDVEVAVDQETATADVDELAELKDLAATDEGEAELEALSETSRQLVSDLSGTQETAIDLLNDHIQTAADAFGMISYYFYCPDCKTDDIESRLQLADTDDRQWYCETCRSHYEPDLAVPRHRIKDEIVNPVWDQLWREKDDERRRIYENIEDQKADLREREFEQRREEIRSAADRIQDLRSKIRDLQTTAQAARGTVDEIGALMVQYEHLNEQRKEEFRTEVEHSFAQIDEKTERILEETRNEEQERIEEAERAAAERAEVMREEERKREQTRFIAEQRLENQRTAAQLQQQAEIHQDDLLLETRGKISASDNINGLYHWKIKTLGASSKGGDR